MNTSLRWLGASLFLWGIGESMFLLFQPIYLQSLGASPIEIGIILGAFGAAMTMTHIPAGHLSDRLGRKPMLLAAWITGLAATIGMALARNLSLFVAALLAYGLTAFVMSPLDSYTTAARGKWSVGRAITFISMMFNAGAVIGPLIGGRIADHYGFRAVYYLAASLFLLSTVAVWFIRRQPRDHHDPANPPAALTANKDYLGFLGILFFVAFAAYVPQPLSPNYLQNQQGLSLSLIGDLIAFAYLGNTVLTLALGQLEAKLGFLLGQLGVGAFAAILWRATGFGWFAIAFFLLGGFRVLRGLGVAQVRTFVHQSQMGLAYGAAETVASISMLLAPPLAGLLYSREPTLMYPVGLAFIVTGVAVTLVFVRRAGVLPPEHIELAPDH
jgi:MFS family permease